MGMACNLGALGTLSLVSQWVTLSSSFTVVRREAAGKYRCLWALLCGDNKREEVLGRPSIARPVWKQAVPQRAYVPFQSPGQAAAPALSCPRVTAARSWVWFFPLDCELHIRQNLWATRQDHSRPSANL